MRILSRVCRSTAAAIVACGFLAAAAGGFPALAFAADSPVSVIPDTADIVIRFKKPKATVDAVVKFAQAIDSKAATQVRQFSGSLTALISNPAGTGIDPKLDWYFILFVEPRKDPSVVFAVPVTKHDVFEAAVKQSLSGAKFSRHDNWSFYASKDGPLVKLQDGLNGKAGSISRKMDSESQGLFDRSDLAAYVNVNHLTNDVYKIEMDATREELDAVLSDVGAAAPKVDNYDMKPLVENYTRGWRNLLQIAADVDSVTAGMSLKGNGLDLEQFVKVKSGSPTSAFLQSNAPNAMSVMDKLPANRLLYFGMHGDLKGMNKWALQLARSLMQNQSGSTGSIDDVLGAYDEVELGTQATAIGLGDRKSGIMRLVTVSEMKPMEKARDLMRKATVLSNQGGSDGSALETEAEDVNGQKIDRVKVKISEDFFGTEDQGLRIAYLPDYVVQTVGGGQEAMAETLQALAGDEKPKSGSSSGPKPPPGASPSATRQKLAPTANIVVLIDLPGLVSDGLRVASELLGPLVPVQPEQLKKLGLKRSYFGLTLTGDSSGVRVKGHMPQGQFQGFYKMQTIIKNAIPKSFFEPSGPVAIPR